MIVSIWMCSPMKQAVCSSCLTGILGCKAVFSIEGVTRQHDPRLSFQRYPDVGAINFNTYWHLSADTKIICFIGSQLLIIQMKTLTHSREMNMKPRFMILYATRPSFGEMPAASITTCGSLPPLRYTRPHHSFSCDQTIRHS